MKYIKLYLRKNVDGNPVEFSSNENNIEYHIGDRYLTIYTKDYNYFYSLDDMIKMDKCF